MAQHLIEKARIPALAAKVVANVARERLRPPTVTSISDVPPSADGLTAEWLTGALCGDVPGARVERVEVVGGSDGTSSRRALELTYNRVGEEAGLPAHAFVKSAASLQSRLMLVLGQVTESETIFYRHIRPQLPDLRSPAAFHAASDPRTFRSIAVLEDLSVAGYRFPDPMQDTVSRRDAEDMVDQMAYYHGSFWDDPRLRTGPIAALPDTLTFQQRLNDVGLLRRARVGVERTAHATPPRVRARRHEILDTTMRALALNAAGVPTVLHQDVHHGNWMRDPDGRMGLYDWQAVARGEWALDYVYALAVNLTPDDRRAWERDLLARYLERLAEHGVTRPPSFDEAWLRYRQQPFHVAIFALFTIGAGRMQPDMQPRAYMMRCWERIATFMDDHDSLDAVP